LNFISRIKTKVSSTFTYILIDLIEELFEGFTKETINLNYSAGQTKNGDELIIYGDKIVSHN